MLDTMDIPQHHYTHKHEMSTSMQWLIFLIMIIAVTPFLLVALCFIDRRIHHTNGIESDEEGLIELDDAPFIRSRIASIRISEASSTVSRQQWI